MANTDPKPHLKQYRFESASDTDLPLAKKPLAIRYEQDVDEILRNHPQTQVIARKLMRKALIDAGMLIKISEKEGNPNGRN